MQYEVTSTMDGDMLDQLTNDFEETYSVYDSTKNQTLVYTLVKPPPVTPSFLPKPRDEVHAVWINGPAHSGQLGGHWPKFGGSLQSWAANNQCDQTSASVRFTGYTSSGGYCQPSSDNLDLNPHLALYSGKVGMILDASFNGENMIPKLGSTGSFPFPNGFDANSINRNLTSSQVKTTLSLTCPGLGEQVVKASPVNGERAMFGLVRQGHAVSHITVHNLGWNTATGQPVKTSNESPRCDDSTPQTNPDNANCLADYGNTDSRSCQDPEYPICVGFIAGQNWGRCYEITAIRDPNTINCAEDYQPNANDPCPNPTYPTCDGGKCYETPAKDPSNQNCNQNYNTGTSKPCLNPEFPTCKGFIQGVKWGTCYTSPVVDPNNPSCTQDYGPVTSCQDPSYPICNYERCYADLNSCFLREPWYDVTVWGDSIALHFHWDGTTNVPSDCTGTVTLEAQIVGETPIQVTKNFKTSSEASMLLTAKEGDSILTDNTNTDIMSNITVTSPTASGIVKRDTFGDFVVEVPTNTPKCSYTNCGQTNATVDVSITNSGSEIGTVRLALSRNFYTGAYQTYSKSQPAAEITGMNVFMWNSTTQQPNGIPIHISKNWHGDGSNVYRGTWWTANTLFNVPAGETLDLTFVLVYEQYRAIPAYSHAQLSIVGYSNGWLWEEGGLGAGGENVCMDPLGTHTRSVITDVRPTLWDGDWKENVGGGDFLIYFDQGGVYRYKKGMDAIIHANGPSLSNSTYTYMTDDDAVHSYIQFSGARTDDVVRVFFHVRYHILKDIAFSRLAFFQMGSETYNYHSEFSSFSFGDSTGTQQMEFDNTCSTGTGKASTLMYDSVNGPSATNVYKETLAGPGPWWFSHGNNEDSVQYTNGKMVVGDKGFIVRSYDAVLGGTQHTSPSLSILCNRAELGVPDGVTALQVGDYVDMQIEMIVLPREGDDFATAILNSPSSNGLQTLNNLSTSTDRIREHALRNIEVTSVTPSDSRIESHYPIRICVGNTSPTTKTTSLSFTTTGTAIGFVPIVICDVKSADGPSSSDSEYGLWMKRSGETTYRFLSEETDARQVNYIRSSDTSFEWIFNVEILESADGIVTEFSFGSDPN
jgi:hypothetical protein